MEALAQIVLVDQMAQELENDGYGSKYELKEILHDLIDDGFNLDQAVDTVRKGRSVN